MAVRRVFRRLAGFQIAPQNSPAFCGEGKRPAESQRAAHASTASRSFLRWLGSSQDISQSLTSAQRGSVCVGDSGGSAQSFAVPRLVRRRLAENESGAQRSARPCRVSRPLPGNGDAASPIALEHCSRGQASRPRNACRAASAVPLPTPLRVPCRGAIHCAHVGAAGSNGPNSVRTAAGAMKCAPRRRGWVRTVRVSVRTAAGAMNCAPTGDAGGRAGEQPRSPLGHRRRISRIGGRSGDDSRRPAGEALRRKRRPNRTGSHWFLEQALTARMRTLTRMRKEVSLARPVLPDST